MKQLFEYTDNVLLMKDKIFPCLKYLICDLEKKGRDLESLRCVCKKLNKIIPSIVKNDCKKWKNKCAFHCKAYPFYKHLDNKYNKHRRYLIRQPMADTNLHFLKSERYMANIFRTHFSDKISTNNQGKPKTCCGGLGFKIVL